MKEKLPVANVRTVSCKNVQKFEFCTTQFTLVFRTTPEINTDYFATQYQLVGLCNEHGLR
jgi:hypothetical protein